MVLPNLSTFASRLFTRDHAVWFWGLIGAAAAYVASSAGVISPAHAAQVKEIAGAVGTLCGWLGKSPLPKGTN